MRENACGWRCTKGLTGIDVHGEVLSAQKESGIISDVVRVRENAGSIVSVDVGPLLGDRKGVVFPSGRSSVDFKSDGADEIQAGQEERHDRQREECFHEET